MLRKFALILVLVGLLAAMVPATYAGGYCAQWHTVQRGENLYRISLQYDSSVRYLAWLNQLPDANRILATQQLCIRPATPIGTPYVVQHGDNVYRIARNFGVDMQILAQHNDLENINLIYTGQTLYIPDFKR